MEPGAALAQPRSTPNYNGNAAFLNILLKDDDKVVWLWNEYKASSGQWSRYLARCAKN
jgi:hypothetical protein